MAKHEDVQELADGVGGTVAPTVARAAQRDAAERANEANIRLRAAEMATRVAASSPYKTTEVAELLSVYSRFLRGEG